MLGNKVSRVPARSGVESDPDEPAQHRIENARLHSSIQVMVFGGKRNARGRFEGMLREQHSLVDRDFFQVGDGLLNSPERIFVEDAHEFGA